MAGTNGAVRVTRGPAGKGEALLAAFGGMGIGRGAERGFCDRGDAGADVPAVGLTNEGVGITGGTCDNVFSIEEDDGLPGDAMEGVFVSDGVEDRLCADGTAGSAFSDKADGEI